MPFSRDVNEPSPGRGRRRHSLARSKRTSPFAKPCVDHEGTEFPSIAAMCRAWGVSYGTYFRRRADGWDLRRSLEPTDTSRQAKRSVDHLGNMFPSIKAMCRHWGVNQATFSCRVHAGWTLEQALTGEGPTREGHNCRPCVDHLGQEFPSVTAMCRHWGVSPEMFRHRRAAGRTVADSLSPYDLRAPSDSASRTDHLGHEFPTKQAMCERWGVPRNVLNDRLHRGWTLERALTQPVRAKAADHA